MTLKNLIAVSVRQPNLGNIQIIDWAVQRIQDLEQENEELKVHNEELQRYNVGLAEYEFSLKQALKNSKGLVEAHKKMADAARKGRNDTYENLSHEMDKKQKLEQERNQLKTEVEALKPYKDNHINLMNHINQHDAEVIEKAAQYLSESIPDNTHGSVIFADRYVYISTRYMRDYANQLRQKAQDTPK